MKTSASLIWVIFFSILFFGISTVYKVYINANSEFQTGEELFAQNNHKEAVVHFERVIRWYIPGLNLKDKAAQKLWEIAQNYEADHKLENALNTYRILRSGFYSARSFYTPGRIWIDKCNDKIAEIMANKSPTLEIQSAKSFSQRKSEYLSILASEKHPYPFWSFLAVTGFLGWVSCAVMFIIRGITKSGQIVTRQAAYWTGGFLLSYGVWLVGMIYV
jgi:hypothetical protein